MTLTLQSAARTEIGRVRRRNEDSLYAGRSLFAVADGLGGHTAGDVASNTVIETLRTYDREVDPTALPDVLGHAVTAANLALRRKTEDDPALAGMGTTLVAMLWSETAGVLANVGDSRIYRLRRKNAALDASSKLTQLTEDHTYEHLVADAADVPNLPARLARFLDGRADGRSPDLTAVELQPGDRFLLCSDGLSSVVPHELISASLSSSSDPNSASESLVALALDHGGPDNVSVIVIDVSTA